MRRTRLDPPHLLCRILAQTSGPVRLREPQILIGQLHQNCARWRVGVPGEFLVRADVDPKHPDEFIFQFHLIVPRVNLRGIQCVRRKRSSEGAQQRQRDSHDDPRHGRWLRRGRGLAAAGPWNSKHERASTARARRILDPLSTRARHGGESVRPLAEGSVARGIVLDPFSIGCNLRMF